MTQITLMPRLFLPLFSIEMYKVSYISYAGSIFMLPQYYYRFSLIIFFSLLVTETHVVHTIRYLIVHLPEEHRDASIARTGEGRWQVRRLLPRFRENCISSRVCIYFLSSCSQPLYYFTLGRIIRRAWKSQIPRLSSRPTLSASLSHVNRIQR